MDSTRWRLHCSILSGVLLIGPDYDVVLSPGETQQPLALLGVPKELCRDALGIQSRLVIERTWLYPLTLYFSISADEDPRVVADKRLTALTSRLSFISSVPVVTERLQSITDADEPPVPGKKYTSIQFAQHTTISDQQHVLTREQLEHAKDVLLAGMSDEMLDARIERALQWWQHSLVASSATDEFVCLMLAFEALSGLLSSGEEQFWECSACGCSMPQCPSCAHSTAWKGSGASAMRDFVVQRLGWQRKDWRDLWAIRSKILHGTTGLTFEEQMAVSKHLSALEKAIASLLKHLLKLAPDAPPNRLRPRHLFSAATVKIDWTAPQ